MASHGSAKDVSEGRFVAHARTTVAANGVKKDAHIASRTSRVVAKSCASHAAQSMQKWSSLVVTRDALNAPKNHVTCANMDARSV
mmetsp:Transcript_27661/g.73814  ORF Transcript_27661/g.73814 Transcript_27661/m.73814 type:complete len:85 (+) Transcript_27661:1-255(+)